MDCNLSTIRMKTTVKVSLFRNPASALRQTCFGHQTNIINDTEHLVLKGQFQLNGIHTYIYIGLMATNMLLKGKAILFCTQMVQVTILVWSVYAFIVGGIVL